MGIFDNVKSDSGKDEVEINVSDSEDSVRVDSSDQKESRLKNDVESSLTGSSSSGSSASPGSSSVSLEDIHSQNQRIIELLQRLADQNNNSSSTTGSSSVSGSSTSRSSRSQENDENEMSGGLDGVL